MMEHVLNDHEVTPADDEQEEEFDNDDAPSEIAIEASENKIDNLFVLGHGQLIPREIFHLIMSFIPAFPMYFMLRSVCSHWLSEFEEHIYANVRHLNLVDDGKPIYYLGLDKYRQDTVILLKPIGFIGTKDSRKNNSYSGYNKTKLFEFLAKSFPNVTHLRLGLGCFDATHFSQCVKTMLPMLTQLETLDILGTVGRPIGSYRDLGQYQFELLAHYLPTSTKNLNLIGITLSSKHALAQLMLFSNKGRGSSSKARKRPPRNSLGPSVDIQSVSLPYMFLPQDQPTINDWESCKHLFSHFEVSVVVESCNNDSASTLPAIVSYVDYLNYMSKKEGVVLSLMKYLSRSTHEVRETVLEITARENSSSDPIFKF